MQIVRNVRNTFSINANWKLDNVNKHWVSDKGGEKQEQFMKLNDLKVYTINNIIEGNTKHHNIPELYPNFKDDRWKVLFERSIQF